MAKALPKALSKLSPRLRVFVQGRLDGLSKTAAAAAAGSTDPTKTGYDWSQREDVKAALDAAVEDLADEVVFGRQEAHDMLMQAYYNAATASEQIQAVRELVNLHALAKPKVVEHKHEHTHQGQLELMTDRELMKLAEMDDLALEGEYEVVDADETPALEAPDTDERPAEDY